MTTTDKNTFGILVTDVTRLMRKHFDRRAWRLYLTARAHAVVDDMDSISTGLFRDAQKGISAADLKTMMGVLGRMKDNLNALDSADE